MLFSHLDTKVQIIQKDANIQNFAKNNQLTQLPISMRFAVSHGFISNALLIGNS